jgi:sporulation protein YlmC with PRC-barrel domain
LEIEYGAKVVDKRGKVLGVVDKVVLDKWSGEIAKFKVNTGRGETDLLISPEDVSKATPGEVKLKIDMDKPQPQMEVEYGAEVYDKNEKLIGKIDYIARDAWTGEVGKFKVSSKKAKIDLLISTDDVLGATPTRVKLGVTLDELKSSS